MSEGHVYILSNYMMPGVYKIGRTKEHPGVRARQLYTSGVPKPFSLEFCVFSPDSVRLEKAMHEAFNENRTCPNREFFSGDLDNICDKLEELHKEIVFDFVERYLEGHFPFDYDEHAFLCDTIQALTRKVEALSKRGHAS
jgi:hypothetical protein